MFQIGVSSVNIFTIGYKASISFIMKTPYVLRAYEDSADIERFLI